MTPLQQFIWEHRDDDPARLALSAKKYPDRPMAYVARQVDALAKLRRKIPSWYQPGLDFPVPISLEQASSEATARFKASLFAGAAMADLTGGLGVDASFFASRFDQVYYVEKVPEILAAAQHNLTVLGRNNMRFVPETAEQFLRTSHQKLEMLYLDPARRDDRKGKVFQLADCSPNVLEIKDLLLENAPEILIKTAPMLDMHQAVRQLKNVAGIWVLEYEGDCREVLYLLKQEAPNAADIPVRVVALDSTGTAEHTFDFTFQEEQLTQPVFSPPAAFLYEPIPAILKAGAFKSFARRFGLNKLHPNTHLYTSSEWKPGLPARSFRIDAICKYDRKAVAQHLPEEKANITTRNFPDTTEQVRKKLGLRDGGNTYVFAATDCDEKKQILICSKV